MLEFALLILVTGAPTLLVLVEAGGHGHGHRHVIIHVPYKVKTIHHTHTITKHVHHKDDGDKYEVLGYTVGHPIDLGGDHGHDQGGGAGAVEHDFKGGHDFGGGHNFAGAEWMGDIGETVKTGGGEDSESGHISGHEFHSSGYSGLTENKFSMGGYGTHEDFSSH